jgi:hypothetical protein
MKKKLDNQKLVANSNRVPSIVIGTIPKKAMESMKRKEQVPRRHYLVVMRLRARPSLCSESTQEASTSSVAMERMFTLVIHH